ncbi:MAG: hypothetical protein AB8C95_14535 [Phycisphaeraceae bacterium]
MNDTNPTQPPQPTPKSSVPPNIDKVSPDELMSDFRGHSLVKIVVFTVIVHIFVLAIFSPGTIKTQVFGESNEPAEEVAEMSDEEKMDKAQKDGKAALREVADRYGMTIKQLREQLDAEPSVQPVNSSDTTTPATEPSSQIERDLEVEVEGPAVPDLSVDEEEDLFAPETP